MFGFLPVYIHMKLRKTQIKLLNQTLKNVFSYELKSEN